MVEFVQPEYLWLVVVGSFAAFAYGWATGANDVANAFGTSVGAKTLTLKQAVLIAAIVEFAGALVLGRVSTSTIAGGIAKIDVFYREPEIYAYGMVCALSVGFVWQGLASYWEMNVSATHSIIGSIIGFALVYGGKDAVNWATPDTTSFPPYKGVVPIILSWFVSPVLTGVVSCIVFLMVRTFVLRRENSYRLAFWVLPPMVILTSWVNIFFVFTKGAKKMLAANSSWSDAKASWIAAVCAAGLGILTGAIVLPMLRFKANKKFQEDEDAKANAADEQAKAKDVDLEAQPSSKFMKAMRSFRDAAMHGMEVDIHAAVDDDPIVAAIHRNAEVFDPKAEYAFSYLQVFSAICVIFAHGAGEVGYMAGPLTTIWFAVRDGILPSKVNAPIWTIVISAAGLVVGLATYGYNVTRAVGVRFSKLSPTRGFSAELSTALIIMIAAQYGLPTSSSQCITGGIVGLGMLEGKSGVNWRFLMRTFASWAATLFVVALGTAALFAGGVYAPSISCNNVVRTYEDTTINLGLSIVKDVNSTLFAYKDAANSGRLPHLNATQWSTLNSSISAYSKKGSGWLTFKSQGTVDPDASTDFLLRGVALLQNNSILTLGQEQVFSGAAVCNDASFNLTSPSYNAKCKAPNSLSRMPKGLNATKWA